VCPLIAAIWVKNRFFSLRESQRIHDAGYESFANLPQELMRILETNAVQHF
jgi:uncharacterized protein YxjI